MKNRIEKMTLGTMIDRWPANSDSKWTDALGLNFDSDTEEADFLKKNMGRIVQVWWPEHCLTRRLTGDATYQFVNAE